MVLPRSGAAYIPLSPAKGETAFDPVERAGARPQNITSEGVSLVGEDHIVAPLCSNCGGTEFVWAGELKTGGRLGQGPLALRSGGELPLGTRICRACGHADLFLRDTTILQNPHHWRPNEFVPISSPAPAHHARETTKTTAPAVTAPAAAPAAPASTSSGAQPMERPIFVEAPVTPSPAREPAAPATSTEAMPAEGESSAKKPSKRRSPRAKKPAEE